MPKEHGNKTGKITNVEEHDDFADTYVPYKYDVSEKDVFEDFTKASKQTPTYTDEKQVPIKDKDFDEALDKYFEDALKHIHDPNTPDVVLRVKETAIDRSNEAHSGGFVPVDIPILKDGAPDTGRIHVCAANIKSTDDGWTDVNLGSGAGKYGMELVSDVTGESYHEMHSAKDIKSMNDAAKEYYKAHAAEKNTRGTEEIVVHGGEKFNENDLPF